MNSFTQQGIAALQAGKNSEARHYLKQALQQDPKDIQAWLWLSGAMESDADKAYCLDMVLRMDPENEYAHRGLARLHQPDEIKKEPDEPIQASPNDDDLAEQEIAPAETNIGPFLMNWDEFTAEGLPLSEFLPTDWPAPNSQEVSQPESRGAVNQYSALILDDENEDLAFSHASGQPASPQRKTRKSDQESTMKPWMWAALLGLVVLILLTLFVLFEVLNQLPAKPAVVSSVRTTPSATPTLISTSTPLFVTNTTGEPNQRPGKTPTPTATFIALSATILKQMGDLQTQVVELRGLPAQSPVTNYLITKKQAVDLLNGLYRNDENQAELEKTDRALVALGLIKPDYDLTSLLINQHVDSLGGYYLAEKGQIFILTGTRFGGIERYIYTHEFDHAIVDQSFDLAKILACSGDDQRCQAIQALVEGDAQVLMTQWAKKYATQQDFNSIQANQPPALVLPGPPVPPYLLKELKFPYIQGARFVDYLYQHGQWAGVNEAYARLPASTEQILHPEKYLADEAPLVMTAPDIENALGGDWQIEKSSVLGEWTTYLLLSSGADTTAQIEDATALQAAGGWRGDHYQIYYSPALNKTALAVYWAWDTAKDAQEFKEALSVHVSRLFKGHKIEQPDADCWEANSQISCIYSRTGQTLWLTAPDLVSLTTMWGHYLDFH